MKKISLIALCFSQACFGITPYMRQKFQEVYSQNFPIDEIVNEGGLSIADLLISLAALDNNDANISQKIDELEVIKTTGLKSKLTRREKDEYLNTIKELKKSNSFKKQFKNAGSDNYQASMYQQYEWAQIIDATELPNEKLGELLYFRITCTIQHPGEDISFGEGKTMLIIDMLRRLRELPYYYGVLKTQATLDSRINTMIQSLQYYLGFTPLNTPLIDNLKMACKDFMRITPVAANLDLKNEYSNYELSLTTSPWEKYKMQEAYSVDLLQALQQMHAAEIERIKRGMGQKTSPTERPSSSGSSDGLSSNGSFSKAPVESKIELLQALALADLLP